MIDRAVSRRPINKHCTCYQSMILNRIEILVWIMEDAKMKSNGRVQEWNGKLSSILLNFVHGIYREILPIRMVINSSPFKKVFSIYSSICQQIVPHVLQLCVLCKQCTYCLMVGTSYLYIAICSCIDADEFNVFCFFLSKLTICLVVNFFFHRSTSKNLFIYVKVSWNAANSRHGRLQHGVFCIFYPHFSYRIAFFTVV